MPHSSPPFIFLLLLCTLFTTIAQQLPIQPNPQQQTSNTLHTNPTTTTPTTIPSFPEQSALSACPISLPNDLFPSVKSACLTHSHHTNTIQYTPLHRSRCCPVLAAWLYSSYSATALGRRPPHSAIRTTSKTTTTTIINTNQSVATTTTPPNSYEMPMLPDDSEGCVDGLESAMRENGVNLGRPNSSCDFVYCYCGIRLHQLSCPASFRVVEEENSSKRDLVGDHKVGKLEKDCLVTATNSRNGNGVVGCSKCLNSLYKLNRGTSSSNKSHSAVEEQVRTSKMRSKECELMGLTWLLDKNRTAYLHTVTLVLRALMTINDNNDDDVTKTPVSCGLGRDGMPLPVDSTEVSASSPLLPPSVNYLLLLLAVLVLCLSSTSTLNLHPLLCV